jgi:hypothetical protein
MWHPEKKIGFGYVPFELIGLDMVNVRGKKLQIAVKKCVDGNNPRKTEKSSTCTVF